MKKILIVFITCALLTVQAFGSTTTPILSSREYTVGQGDIEISFLFNPVFSEVNGANFNYLDFDLGVNYFWNDVLAPGVDFGFRAGDGDSFEFIPNLKTYLPNQSRVLPYMKAGIGYSRLAGGNYMAVVLAPGVNYMLSNTVAIGGQLNFEVGVGDQNYHIFQIPIQFALYFKY